MNGGSIMKKKTLGCLIIISIFMACSKDEPSKSTTNPIVGKWTLDVMKVNGETLDYMDEDGIPYQLEFYSDGRGNVWFKDYGQTTDDSPVPFTWSIGGNTLYITPSGDSQLSMTHSISNNVLTLNMTDGSDVIEYIYKKS